MEFRSDDEAREFLAATDQLELPADLGKEQRLVWREQKKVLTAKLYEEYGDQIRRAMQQLQREKQVQSQ